MDEGHFQRRLRAYGKRSATESRILTLFRMPRPTTLGELWVSS